MTHPLDLLHQRNLPAPPEPLPSVVIDSHTHADTTEHHSGLDPDTSLALAASVGIAGFVQVGCDVEGSEYAVALAARRPEVVAAVAIHPNDAARAGDDLEAMITRVDELAGRGPHVRAVGETGLDYYRTTDPLDRAVQRHSFARHIDIARRHGLSLVIHDRDAHADVLAMLDTEAPAPRVVMHSFSGDPGVARQFLDRGAWLSFPGVVTFKNADALREALGVVPLDRILVETDAPYLTPVPLRGRPNAPYLVPHLVRFVAEQLRRPLGEVCAALLTNTHAAFGGPWAHPDAVVALPGRQR